MVRDRAERRLATVLFVDIVDSTRIAAEIGDHRWREVLGTFRRRVRGELKRHGGREQDTAGDGFFATFERPAGAIRAATAIVGHAQSLGLDVRCGVHTGELERIDGHLGGIAAHIGARVMGRAGPAEILVSGTSHDMAVGGDIASVPAEDVELKGVPGRWALHRVTAVDGDLLPDPLAPDEAAERLGLAGARRPGSIARVQPAVFPVAAIGAVFITALGAAILLLPRDAPSAGGEPSPSPSRPPTMVKIDPQTNAIVASVSDVYLPIGRPGQTWIVDGTLWQETPISVVRRDLETGEALATIPKPQETPFTFFGFGSVWFHVHDASQTSDRAWSLHRLDPLSGRTIAVINWEDAVRWVSPGRDAIYAITRDGSILEFDPDENAIVDTDTLGIETIPDEVEAVGDTLWVCECDEGRITHWDPATDQAIKTVEFAQRRLILRDPEQASLAAVSIEQGVVWLMDWGGGTITPVETTTGAAGQPIGIPGHPTAYDFGLGSIWIAASEQVYRLAQDTRRGESISLPDGVLAGGIAVDEASAAVWVSNYAP